MRRSRAPRPKSKTIPVTGISIFVEEKRAEFEALHSDLTKLQLFHAMNQEWTNLDHNIKRKYERKADYLRRSEARKATAHERVSDTESEQPPVTGYSIFLRERHNSLKNGDPLMTLSQRATQIAAEWSGMPKSEKRPYINIAKRETRKLRRISDDEEPGEA